MRQLLFVAVLAVGVVADVGLLSAQDTEKSRIASVRDFPAWQKKPLSRSNLHKLVQALRSSDQATQYDALQKLALARPTVGARDAVYAAARQVHKQHDSKFSKAMLVQINAAWSEADQAAEILQQAKRAGGIKYLEQMVVQGNSLQVGQAFIALGYSQHKSAPALLVKYFNKKRSMAARGLDLIGPPAAAEVVKLLGNSDPFVRNDAVKLLAKIGTADEISAIEKLKSDSNGLVKNSVAEAIKTIKARAAETKQTSKTQ